MKLTITFICILLTISAGFSQKLGRYTLEEWQTIIDTTWGEGVSTESKLAIFDNVYNIIDRNFASFQGLPENILDSLRQIYRPEIEAGVSNGRFVAIMNHFVMAFKESHLWIFNQSVNFHTPLKPGRPFFVIGAWTDNSHFGATLTPLPDSTLLVIKALPDHPLDLVPGDIILGYDGIPWKILYQELLAAQFPLFAGIPYCTTDKAFTHDMLKNAGMNWHLFDTLDVVQYSSGDTLHYPANLLDGQSGNIAGNEQLAVPGVPFPDINWEGVFDYDIYNLKNYVSWGIVEGTNIGYIYAYGWFTPQQAPGSNISEEFYKAVDSLMNYYNVKGLILDDRFCFGGGQFDTEDKGFSLLFNSYIETIDFDRRCGDLNHFNMCAHPSWSVPQLAIPGNPNTFFDKPIAVLTGPGAVSYGDIIPLKLTFHPMVRLFGKSTSGAFSGVEQLRHPGTGWDMYNVDANAFLVSNPGAYLSRTESHVDEDIWLTPEDVAKGEDTVVKRAIEWIQNLAYAHDVAVCNTYTNSNTDTIMVTAWVENPNNHELTLKADIKTKEGVLVDSLFLFDDGMHEDLAANDNLWGNKYALKNEGDSCFSVSVTTTDINAKTDRTLPNVAWVTTMGPVQPPDDTNPYITTDYEELPKRQYFKILLKNYNTQTAVRNIEVTLRTTDSRVKRISPETTSFDDLEPGAVDTCDYDYSFYYAEGYDPHNSKDKPIKFEMLISSNDIPYWKYTFDYITGIESDLVSAPPLKFNLSQNYPNPFNPKTVIHYALPVTCHIDLSIYNLLGQKVATLVDKKQPAGSYQVQWDATGFSTGVYYYRLHAGDFVETKKLILLK